MRRACELVCGISIVAAFASPVGAEVMDKMPSEQQVFYTSLLGALIGCAVCRVAPWWGIASFVLAILYPLGMASEATDPFMGPAILNEAGPSWGGSPVWVAGW